MAYFNNKKIISRAITKYAEGTGGAYGDLNDFTYLSTDEVIICEIDSASYGKKLKLVLNNTYTYEFVIPNPSNIFNGSQAVAIEFGVITALNISAWTVCLSADRGHIYIKDPMAAFGDGSNGELFTSCKYAIEV